MSARQQRVARQISELMRDRDFAAAEAMTREALEKQPDNLSLRYNLAQALMAQSRADEALEMVRAIHAQHPDYTFASAHLARHHVSRGEAEAARALLDPLMQKDRFHISEYSAWAGAQIQLLLLEDKTEAAAQWLEMWRETSENFDYEHPTFPVVEKLVKQAKRKRK